MKAKGKPKRARIEIEPTPAMSAGEGFVTQCSECGTLVAGTEKRPRKLGACPVCRKGQWWDQSFPVGPFQLALFGAP